MEIIIYGLIFIIGTLFGSFFTLAVYRIPLGLNIVYEHSFCPKCNTKLKFIDLIPIVSYLSLGGRCRYCKEKVRIRYLLLEVLSGTVFVLFALSLRLDFFNISLDKIISFLFLLLYICTLFIIAGIDKEKIVIQKSVLVFSLILGVCFMIYACISNTQVIYTYIIYLVLILLMLILDTFFLKKNLCENYTTSILIFTLYMIIFSGAEVFYFTVATSVLMIGIQNLYLKIREASKRKAVINTKETEEKKTPLGFYLAVSNIAVMIITNFIAF